MKILYVVGARPNFMKVAPIIAAMRRRMPEVRQTLVHTGQHFDENMSGTFFRELSLPAPDEYLGVSGGTHAEQTARIMLAFEPVLLRRRPECVVGVGDVNSTLACALVAAKLCIPVAHVEAGLRSGDNTMPEEVNRKVVDVLAELLFAPSEDAADQLKREGIPEHRIFCVGNVMIDTLVAMRPAIRASRILTKVGVKPGGYVLATIHRPSNVDDPDRRESLLKGLERIGRNIPVVFPMHPRTRRRIGQWTPASDVRILDPVGYVDCLSLIEHARVVVTDSGGVQEETTYLGVPCLTVRTTTERPVTITEGTNQLVHPDGSALWKAFTQVKTRVRKARCPRYWDGRAGERIAELLAHRFGPVSCDASC